MGCTQQKVETSESLKDAYFQISEKLVNKEEISSKYIKKLLSGYEYKKDEEFKIEEGNMMEVIISNNHILLQMEMKV